MDAAHYLLQIENLETHFFLDEGVLQAVSGVSLNIGKHKTLGVIGESGCGKSVMAQSILQIVPPPGRIVEGNIRFSPDGAGEVDIARLHPTGEEIQEIRGGSISMIFQEPMTSLSPAHTIEDQLTEMLLRHTTEEMRVARERTLEMLEHVGIPNPELRMKEYPHELCGGLRQRVMIAMALSCSPMLLIADEPTTALDVTVQAQILELMQRLQEEFGMAILFITHDLGIIASLADDVAVMYLGKVVEWARQQAQVDRAGHHHHAAEEGATEGIVKPSSKSPGASMMPR